MVGVPGAWVGFGTFGSLSSGSWSSGTPSPSASTGCGALGMFGSLSSGSESAGTPSPSASTGSAGGGAEDDEEEDDVACVVGCCDVVGAGTPSPVSPSIDGDVGSSSTGLPARTALMNRCQIAPGRPEP